MERSSSGGLAKLFADLACHEPGMPILDVSGLGVRLDGRPALEDISFRLSGGERVAVVGPNGAGKSTLFKVIAGVLRPDEGEVSVFGHGPERHICIAYLPQSSQVDWSFPVSVADVVMMGRVGKLGPLRRPRAADRERVRRCLEAVGLADLAGRQFGELSGGQRQRMFIARALAQEAELMIMDEPLAGLDFSAREEIFGILEELHRFEVTVMVAMHDLGAAAEHFDRVMLLNRRMLGIGSPADVFTEERLRRAYGSHVQLIRTKEGLMVIADTCCRGGEGETGGSGGASGARGDG